MKNTEAKNILTKMTKVVQSSRKEHKAVVARYLSLANRRLHEIINNGCAEPFVVAGTSTSIQNDYIDKFGAFFPASKPVIRKDNIRNSQNGM